MGAFASNVGRAQRHKNCDELPGRHACMSDPSRRVYDICLAMDSPSVPVGSYKAVTEPSFCSWLISLPCLPLSPTPGFRRACRGADAPFQSSLLSPHNIMPTYPPRGVTIETRRAVPCTCPMSSIMWLCIYSFVFDITCSGSWQNASKMLLRASSLFSSSSGTVNRVTVSDRTASGPGYVNIRLHRRFGSLD